MSKTGRAQLASFRVAETEFFEAIRVGSPSLPAQTTAGVPYVQVDVELVPEVHAELMRCVGLLPKMDIRTHSP